MQTHTSERTRAIDERISAYFDGELESGERSDFEARLEQDEELAATVADFEFMRTMVVGTLDHQAERVPEARFEQIWDRFEASLERETRLQEAAEAPPPWWQRLLAWMRPARLPIAAVATVAVVAFVFVRSAGAPEDELAAANTQGDAASVEPDSAVHADPPQATLPQPTPVAPAPKLAAAEPAPAPSVEPEAFPSPEAGEAEIRHIEFGGQVGVISQVEHRRGTTTVIWVTEDEDPVDSERSL